ncbi:dTDP-4-dehydrorhamnose 3,5-epimerase [Leptospira ryugenii]|uniref:dTDP-4-dehydrorhamnose 3,5-epimerase n=1 Tax=Leptospira ryugenii TaxID=1917863 RepID=A0A2P2DVY2_9LEPT|nr:dTDP-4-dehydrorhamnose 3,5-epimerase [Leptospira ryugenii]GBF48783.1 dTDP-4-dehydrorhamnose 3,5-epimerase [Leptospira ryugenii]
MKITETSLNEVLVIEPKIWGDERGYFFESFREDLLESASRRFHWVQDNESKSNKGVLRGLHYQLPPFAQTKLVRVIKGRVLDVAVDIRKDSKQFGKHVSIELSEENKKQLLIPRGFAHGFLVLSEEAIFSYKVDNYYSKESERSIIWNDPSIGIDWQIPDTDLILSDKDKIGKTIQEADVFLTSHLYD